MIACALFALLIAPTPDDDPAQPSIAAIVAGLKQTEAAIHDLAVATDYVKLQKYLLKVDEPVRLELRTEFIVTGDGKGWYECLGEQIARTSEGVRTYRRRLRTAFDGKVARSLDGEPDFAYRLDGAFQFGSIDDYPAWHGIFPLEYTTRYNSEPVTKILTERPPILAGRAEWDGRPVVILDTPTTVNGGGWKSRFWVDPARRVVVRRSMLRQQEPDKSPWREYTRIESHDHKVVGPGIWLPMRVLYESTTLGKDGKPDELAWSYAGTNSGWKVNQNPPDSTFVLHFPAGLTVNDHRQPPKAETKK